MQAYPTMQKKHRHNHTEHSRRVYIHRLSAIGCGETCARSARKNIRARYIYTESSHHAPRFPMPSTAILSSRTRPAEWQKKCQRAHPSLSPQEQERYHPPPERKRLSPLHSEIDATQKHSKEAGPMQLFGTEALCSITSSLYFRKGTIEPRITQQTHRILIVKGFIENQYFIACSI